MLVAPPTIRYLKLRSADHVLVIHHFRTVNDTEAACSSKFTFAPTPPQIRSISPKPTKRQERLDQLIAIPTTQY